MQNDHPWIAPLKRLPFSLKLIAAMQKKHYGEVLNPTRWWGRTPGLFWLIALFVGYLERRRARLAPELRALIMTQVSRQCRCAFCVDANSLRLAQRSGSIDKVLAVAHWRESALFSDAERAALAYAEGMTATPPAVDGEIKETLLRYYSAEAICELTALIAFQNLSARYNAALDIPAQGLCQTEVPPRA
ncbi:carboxymuconolactone decarboxylase family protein [Apirhabdus apintestini]|nr:carboxymuconolactone decarboxylase family protein [Enterobacteriaceae bacterium CA-0114]